MNQNTPDLAPSPHILQVQCQLTQEIQDPADPLGVVNRVLTLASSLPSLDGIWLWFPDKSQRQLTMNQSAGVSDHEQYILAKVPIDSPLINQLRFGQEMTTGWDQSWPQGKDELQQAGWSDVALWPLKTELDSAFSTEGILGACARHGQTLSDEVKMVLGSLAIQLGGYLRKLRADADRRSGQENLIQFLKAFDDYAFICKADGSLVFSNLKCDPNRGQELSQFLPLLCGEDGAPDPTLRQADPVSMTSRLNLSEEERIPVQIRSFSGQWDGKTVQFFLCRDLSESQTLERERDRLITAIEQSDDSIVITESGGVIQYVNPAFSQLTGYSREEALGGTPKILKSGFHNGDFYKQMWETLSRGETWKGRLINRKKNGDPFTEVATLSPVRDQNGVITHFVGVKRDVTQELDLESRLRQSQKMEAVGMLAGGLAHDFNNILYAVLGYCQLAMDDISDDHPAFTCLEEIEKAGNRASSLVAKMLALGARSEEDFANIQLQPVIQDVLDLARASMPSTIQFDVQMEQNTPGVWADPNQIHQVVLNLCTNAGFAMRDQNGVLKVRLTAVELQSPDPVAWPNLSPGRYLKLVVSDNGLGIKDDVIDKIFEPYYTTKDANEGTGLGLATVQGIILHHQGRIFVETQWEVGSTFTVFLPQDINEAQLEPSPDLSTPERVGAGTVMVVDDEEMIVDVTSRALARQGFEVKTYCESEQAWTEFQVNPDLIDLLITDQTMPGLTGFELAAKMLTIKPDLPIIMTTGYSEQYLKDDLDETKIDVILSKPLKMNVLADHVDKLLSLQQPKVEV